MEFGYIQTYWIFTCFLTPTSDYTQRGIGQGSARGQVEGLDGEGKGQRFWFLDTVVFEEALPLLK
jgi:hypothetical protein